MSRSGYSDDGDDQWAMIRWQGAVKSAIRGKRGQAFLREMLIALDSLPDKRLIAEDLEKDGEVCAIGTVGKLRGIDMSAIDPEEYEQVSAAFGIPQALVREIESINDEWVSYNATPEHRFNVVREWVVENIETQMEVIA